MPLNVDGWCEVVLQLTDGLRRAIGEEREPTRPFAEVVRFDCSRGSVSDGQEFVGVSRSSALIQMKGRQDEVFIGP